AELTNKKLPPNLPEYSRCRRLTPHLSENHSFVTLSPHLLAATTQVLKTINPTNLHLVFQGEPETYLLRELWHQGVGLTVGDHNSWYKLVQRLSYTDLSQHLLVGDTSWLTGILR
ncbi:hypothetical protein Hamer_G008379, partial [Homarus americanus]